MVGKVVRYAALAAVAFSLIGATAAARHLRLVKSEPMADAVVTGAQQIQLWYSEEPALKLTTLKLTGPDGHAHDLEPAVVEGDGKHLAAPVSALADGAYTLLWRTQSKDGHVVSGTLGFTVKADH